MEVIRTNIPEGGPLSTAVRAGSQIYTAMGPLRPDGTLEVGSLEAQATVVFENLKHVLESAGGSLRDVVQVIVYLTDISERPIMTEVWKRYFSAPWPNRATIGVSSLGDPGMRIEIVATAVLKN